MTKAQLEEIFDQMDKGEYDPSAQEVVMLVQEIERLQERLDDIDELVCTTIIGCGKCTTCKTITQLEEKVERLTADMASLESIIDGLERRLDGPNGFRARAEKAEAEVERLTAERDAARHMLEGICGEFERTIRHADWRAAGSKGMSVPFHGDFASIVHLPSIISRMRWWAREMRRVITGEAKNV